MSKPALIVVAGAPASGKTTLARRLAGNLTLPLIEKDVIKEALAEVLAPEDRDASRTVGAASMHALWSLAAANIERGISVMIESNFDRRFAVDDLARMASLARILIVQCVAPPETIERRYRERASAGSRHTAHFDLDALPDLIAGLERGAYDLTTLGYPAIPVDTRDGYRPGYDTILEAIRNHLAQPDAAL